MSREQNRLLEYTDPALEAAWSEDRKPYLMVVIRLAAAATVTIAAFASFRDFILQWDGWLALFAFRWLVLIPLLCLPAALTYTKWGRRNLHEVILTALSAVFITLAMMFSIRESMTPRIEELVGLLFMPVQAVVVALFPLGLRRTLFIVALSLVCFLYVYVFIETNSLHRLVTLYAVFATSFALTVASASRERQGRSAWLASRRLLEEEEKSRQLLLSILPESIAQRLMDGESPIADQLDDVVVLFVDIVGFTELSNRLEADEIVRRLNTIFSEFDDLSSQYNYTKIKTIGDAYMAVGGLPWMPKQDQATAGVKLAIAMLGAIESHEDIDIRIGLNIGPVVAGVIGKDKFIYDLWGATVNLASRMESTGKKGKIQISSSLAARLDNSFSTTPRGPTLVKGVGEVETFWVNTPTSLQ